MHWECVQITPSNTNGVISDIKLKKSCRSARQKAWQQSLTVLLAHFLVIGLPKFGLCQSRLLYLHCSPHKSRTPPDQPYLSCASIVYGPEEVYASVAVCFFHMTTGHSQVDGGWASIYFGHPCTSIKHLLSTHAARPQS